VYAELAKQFESIVGAIEYEFDVAFKRALRTSIDEILVRPLCSTSNAFLKAALFHPTVCWRLQQDVVAQESVFSDCRKHVYNDIAVLSGEKTTATKFAQSAFDHYLSYCKDLFKDKHAPVFPTFEALTQDGVYGSDSALSFWKRVIDSTNTTSQLSYADSSCCNATGITGGRVARRVRVLGRWAGILATP
jgi:hypothetical protein